jgi:hypothetical protein
MNVQYSRELGPSTSDAPDVTARTARTPARSRTFLPPRLPRNAPRARLGAAREHAGRDRARSHGAYLRAYLSRKTRGSAGGSIPAGRITTAGVPRTPAWSGGSGWTAGATTCDRTIRQTRTGLARAGCPSGCRYGVAQLSGTEGTGHDSSGRHSSHPVGNGQSAMTRSPSARIAAACARLKWPCFTSSSSSCSSFHRQEPSASIQRSSSWSAVSNPTWHGRHGSSKFTYQPAKLLSFQKSQIECARSGRPRIRTPSPSHGRSAVPHARRYRSAIGISRTGRPPMAGHLTVVPGASQRAGPSLETARVGSAPTGRPARKYRSTTVSPDCQPDTVKRYGHHPTPPCASVSLSAEARASLAPASTSR